MTPILVFQISERVLCQCRQSRLYRHANHEYAARRHISGNRGKQMLQLAIRQVFTNLHTYNSVELHGTECREISLERHAAAVERLFRLQEQFLSRFISVQ